MRDAAETGLGVFFGVVLAASVATFALIRHRAHIPAPAAPPIPPPVPIPGPVASSPVPAAEPGPTPFHSGVDARRFPGAAPWLPYIEAQILSYGADARGQPVIPVPFVLAWIEAESAGNPCAIGFPGEMDQQGNVLETGLFQLMSPHDVALAGTTVQAMRQCCATQTRFPGLTRASPAAQIAAARAAEQAATCVLTEAAKAEHIRAGLTYIHNITGIVDKSLARYGTSWSKGTPDYWALVKGYHNAASMPTGGVDVAAATLGHAPQSFAELQQGILGSAYYKGLNPNQQASYAHEIAAAGALAVRALAPRAAA
jgi:hypothetical protein